MTLWAMQLQIIASVVSQRDRVERLQNRGQRLNMERAIGNERHLYAALKEMGEAGSTELNKATALSDTCIRTRMDALVKQGKAKIVSCTPRKWIPI